MPSTFWENYYQQKDRYMIVKFWKKRKKYKKKHFQYSVFHFCISKFMTHADMKNLKRIKWYQNKLKGRQHFFSIIVIRSFWISLTVLISLHDKCQLFCLMRHQCFVLVFSLVHFRFTYVPNCLISNARKSVKEEYHNEAF